MNASAQDDVHSYQVADETCMITWGLDAPPVGQIPMHSLVIRGEEPILVDTGAPACREQWLATVQALVDPTDVRWVFLIWTVGSPPPARCPEPPIPAAAH